MDKLCKCDAGMGELNEEQVGTYLSDVSQQRTTVRPHSLSLIGSTTLSEMTYHKTSYLRLIDNK